MSESKKFQSANVITISFAHLIHDVYSSFLAPLLPLLIDKLSLSYSMAGLLTMIQRLPSLLNPIIGMIADKIAVRYLLIFSPALTAVSMSFIGMAPTYGVLVILLLLVGLGAAMFHVPGPVMIKHVSGYRIGKGMSYFMLGGELARSIAPVFVLTAVSLWGLEGTYKLIPIGLLASFLLYFKFRNIPIRNDFKRDGKSGAQFWATFKEYLPMFTTITGIYFFTALLKAVFTAFLPTFITTEGSDIWQGGIALAVLQFTGAIGTLSSGTISDKIGRRNTLLIMAIIAPLLTYLFLFSEGLAMFIVLVVLGFFLIASTPVILAVVNDTKSHHPAFINGVQMAINFLTGAVTVLIVGVMGDLFGLLNTYIISATLAFFAIPFILKLEKK